MKAQIRRTLLSCIGILFLALFSLWSLFLSRDILREPKDFSFSADILSIDNFYDESRGAYTGEIFSVTDYEYETVSSDTNAIEVQNTFDVKTPEGDPIFAVTREYGIDRSTGAHIETLGDRERTGYLFAPRGLKEGEEFTYWHVNYDGPADMHFVEKTELYGLPVYKYFSVYSGTSIDQTGNLTHLPGVGETRGIVLDPYLELWVEPVTGRLVKYADDTVAYYYDLETGEQIAPWNHFSNTFREVSVQQTVNTVRWLKTWHQTVQTTIPVVLCLLALLCFLSAFGFWKVFSATPVDRFRLVIGSLVLVAASVTFIGWAFDLFFLTRFVAFSSAMNPVTAVCFMVLAIGILGFSSKFISALSGLFITVIGLLKFAYVVGLSSIAVDQLLFTDALSRSPVFSDMADFTALSFILIGFGLLTSHIKSKNAPVAKLLYSSSAFLSFLGAAGILFDALTILNLPIFFSAAVHTIALFMISSFVLFAAAVERSEHRYYGATSFFVVAMILFGSILTTVILSSFTSQTFENDAESTFEVQRDQIRSTVENRFDVYINALAGGVGLFSASENVSREEWSAYVSALEIQKNYPGIQGIGYAVFVKSEELTAHIETIRSEGFPEYMVKPEGQRDLYSAIIYLEPFDERNRQAFGFDMFQEPNRRAAMERARDTGAAAMSARITLVQEIDEDVQPGFLIYLPVYANGSSHETASERQEHIVGYVYSPFRSRNFVEGVFGTALLDSVGFTLYDGAEKTDANILFSNVEEVLKGSKARFTYSENIFVAGRLLTLEYQSTSDYGATYVSRAVPLLVILGGFFATLLLTLTLYTIFSSRDRALQMVDKATKELKDNKGELEQALKDSRQNREQLERAKVDLQDRLEDFKRLNKLMVGRELKMKEMKDQLKGKEGDSYGD